MLVVLTGEVDVVVGDDCRRFSSGGLAVVPAEVPHDVIGAAEGTARVIGVFPFNTIVSVFDDEWGALRNPRARHAARRDGSAVMTLDYRFQARLTDTVEIGPVSGGIRFDNYFDGRVTDGPPAGARVRGIDQVRIRDDGSVVLDVRETIETHRGAISADVRGYAIPDPDAPHVHEIRGFALFDTAVREYVAYNTAVVAIHGSVDMATRELEITGGAVTGDPSSAG